MKANPMTWEDFVSNLSDDQLTFLWQHLDTEDEIEALAGLIDQEIENRNLEEIY